MEKTSARRLEGYLSPVVKNLFSDLLLFRFVLDGVFAANEKSPPKEAFLLFEDWINLLIPFGPPSLDALVGL